MSGQAAPDPTTADGFTAAALESRAALWRIAARMVDADAAEDLVQETFARAFATRATFRGEGRPFAWLCGVLLNVCRSERRRRQVRRALSLHREVEPGGEALAPPDPAAGPPARLEQDERQAALHAAIARLPHKQRGALVLVALEGLPVPEAARVLDTTEQAVWQALSRGRARLRQELAP